MTWSLFPNGLELSISSMSVSSFVMTRSEKTWFLPDSKSRGEINQLVVEVILQAIHKLPTCVVLIFFTGPTLPIDFWIVHIAHDQEMGVSSVAGLVDELI